MEHAAVQCGGGVGGLSSRRRCSPPAPSPRAAPGRSRRGRGCSSTRGAGRRPDADAERRDGLFVPARCGRRTRRSKNWTTAPRDQADGAGQCLAGARAGRRTRGSTAQRVMLHAARVRGGVARTARTWRRRFVRQRGAAARVRGPRWGRTSTSTSSSSRKRLSAARTRCGADCDIAVRSIATSWTAAAIARSPDRRRREDDVALLPQRSHRGERGPRRRDGVRPVQHANLVGEPHGVDPRVARAAAATSCSRSLAAQVAVERHPLDQRQPALERLHGLARTARARVAAARRTVPAPPARGGRAGSSTRRRADARRPRDDHDAPRRAVRNLPGRRRRHLCQRSATLRLRTPEQRLVGQVPPQVVRQRRRRRDNGRPARGRDARATMSDRPVLTGGFTPRQRRRIRCRPAAARRAIRTASRPAHRCPPARPPRPRPAAPPQRPHRGLLLRRHVRRRAAEVLRAAARRGGPARGRGENRAASAGRRCASSTFDGLRSRCTSPRSCANCSASARHAAIQHIACTYETCASICRAAPAGAAAAVATMRRPARRSIASTTCRPVRCAGGTSRSDSSSDASVARPKYGMHSMRMPRAASSTTE